MRPMSLHLIMSRHLLLWVSVIVAAGIMQTGWAFFVPMTLQTRATEGHHRRRVVTGGGNGPLKWPAAQSNSPFTNMMLPRKSNNNQQTEKPHPPDTAPPKSKFDEISSILAAATNKQGKVDSADGVAGKKLEGISNILKALKINIGNSSESKGKSSNKETKKHQQVEAPFFLNEQGKAVESSFESLEGGMDAGLQLTSSELLKNKEEEKKRNKAMVDKLKSSITSTFASTSDNVMSPLIQGKVESQVPEQAIKGAILAGVFITALAGKGAAMSGAAGLGAAYVAITAGPMGQAVRALGGLTWDVANKGMNAYNKAEEQGKVDKALRTMAEYQLPETWENKAAERALWDTKRPEYWKKQNELTRRSLLAYRLTIEARERTERATLQAIEESHKLELATLQREQAKLAEESRLAAEEARLAMEAKKLAEEMRIKEKKAAAVEEQKRLREAKRLEAEAKRLENEARMLEEETRRLEQEAEQVRRAREQETAEAAAKVAAEKEHLRKAEQAHLEAEAAKAKALEEETRRLQEEETRLQAQEELLFETARQAEQARISANNKKDAKAKEEEAKIRDIFNSATAEKMKSGAVDSKLNDFDDDYDDDDDIQGQFDEEDWEASIRAAQQSIDGNIAGLADSLSFVDDDAKADWDRASQRAQGLGARQRQPDDDVEEEMDLEAIGIAARNAVKAFEEQAQTVEKGKMAQRQQWEDEMVTDSEIDEDDVFYDDDMVDYSDMTISELKGELKRRGLPTSGGKKDMVSMLEEDDMAEDSFDKAYDGDAELEYFEMTVAELKEELQRRGLPTIGGKKDMVSRLEKDDMEDEDDPFDEDDNDAVAYVGGPFDNNINEAINGAMATNARGSSPNPADFEGLARAAREAVEMFESGGETDQQDSDDDDWSTYTVAELREELRNRGLPTKGKKTELVALLQHSDQELAEAEGEDDLVDINAIGLAAREAFDSMVFAPASADDEPSDEALWEIEQDAIATEVAGVADYDNMTIAQLKDELRGRGLRLSGKKSELIERLRASSS